MWRLEGDDVSMHAVLYGTIVIDRARAGSHPASVMVNGYASPEAARAAALNDIMIQERLGLTLTGMWVVRDAVAGDDGDLDYDIRTIHSLHQFGLTEHMEARTVDVIAEIQMRGEVLHV